MENASSTLTVRLPTLEKQAFDRLCKALDITPSQVIRRTIREMLAAAHAENLDLFPETKPTTAKHPPHGKKKGR